MIKIVSAYPDFLNLYGEYAAVKILVKRLEGCGEQVEYCSFTMGEYLDFSEATVLYFGAGTEDRMLAALEDFRRYRKEYGNFIMNGGLVVANGNSGAIFCDSINDTRKNITHEGMGLISADAEIVSKRRYGEVICSCDLTQSKIIGAVNSSINFKRKEGQKEFFRVLWDSSGRFPKEYREGFETENVIATEVTGPLLYRNPALLDAFAQKISKKGLPKCEADWYKEMQEGYIHIASELSRESKIAF